MTPPTKYSTSDKKINIDIEMFEVLYIIIYVGCNQMNLPACAEIKINRKNESMFQLCDVCYQWTACTIHIATILLYSASLTD